MLLLYGGLSLFFDLHAYEPFWLGLVGLTWGFHLTFTLTALATDQPDIAAYGKPLSYALIYLMNVLGLCLWHAMVVTPIGVQLLERLVQDQIWVIRGLGTLLTSAGSILRTHLSEYLPSTG